MTFDLGYALLWPPFWATLFTLIATLLRLHLAGPCFPFGWFAGGFGVTLAYLVVPHWLLACIGIGHMAFGAWLWWLDRRKRKRAPALAGAKSRARIAALVRKAREAGRPRKVLRPVPGGARAVLAAVAVALGPGSV
jgi:hypothetical protein